ncbi:Copia protein like [Verticillium longisporum]|nr:Copia protein like [Verticillium longisporum]
MASDASFADNTLDRKSSQAYAMTLFGGTIGWRANKQSTVTTSTTEAELLALSQAAKEAMFVSRLIKELGVTLDDERIRIRCDNQQTIKLVNKDIATLRTKLRHVDIHNHWLRQEAQKNRILVEYIPTANMIADGLTKPLNHQRLQIFTAQIGLIDISDRLEGRLLRPIEKQELWERMEELEIGD